MGLIRLLLSDPAAFILLAVLLLYSVIFHEVAHGWVAYKMGDETARWLGRLTLNPLKHLDPMGTLVLVLTQMIGWAKPVPINPAYYKDYRRGILYVSLAGPVANFCVMLFFAALLKILVSVAQNPGAEALEYILRPMINIAVAGIFINAILGTFNLLEAVRRFSPDSFIITASTNKVYGKMAERGVVERNGRYEYADLPGGVDERQPLDFHSPYGCSKGTADQYTLDYSRIFGIPVMAHCEDTDLSAGGLMHEGHYSTLYGIKGIPAEAEEIMVERDIALARLTGGRLHICHVSTAASLAAIAKAKACLLYTSPSPRDRTRSRMPSSA